MKQIWNKIKSWKGWETIKWIIFWVGVTIAIMLLSIIVFIIAGILMIASPFLVIFPKIREKLLEDLLGKERKRKEAIIEKVNSPDPDVEDDNSYYYFSR